MKNNIIVTCGLEYTNAGSICSVEAEMACVGCGLWFCREHLSKDKHRCKSDE